jgi:hypothetical protein
MVFENNIIAVMGVHLSSRQNYAVYRLAMTNRQSHDIIL